MYESLRLVVAASTLVCGTSCQPEPDASQVDLARLDEIRALSFSSAMVAVDGLTQTPVSLTPESAPDGNVYIDMVGFRGTVIFTTVEAPFDIGQEVSLLAYRRDEEPDLASELYFEMNLMPDGYEARVDGGFVLPHFGSGTRPSYVSSPNRGGLTKEEWQQALIARGPLPLLSLNPDALYVPSE